MPQHQDQTPRTILVTPLHWGLGHATRCIPIVRILESIGYHVIIGGNTTIHEVFRAEFSDLEYVLMPQNDISYGKDKFTTQLKLVQQSAKLLGTIKQEKEWIRHFVRTRRVDGIISDNRYGCYHPEINSIIITHQLSITTGLGKLGNYLARRLNLTFLAPFNAIWVPDYEGKAALAGALSTPQPFQQHLNIKYLGPLSRMVASNQASPYSLIILLSGPEPQRSILEENLRRQTSSLPYNILLIRGVVNNDAPIVVVSDNLDIIDYASSEQLACWLSQAEWVVARSGYTTVMDLSAMGKKAILIPTPGQAEQAYLADHLAATGRFYCVQQGNVDLAEDLQQATLFYTLHPVKPASSQAFTTVVQDWAGRLG